MTYREGLSLPQIPVKRGLRNEKLRFTCQMPWSMLVLASCMTCELLGLIRGLGLIPWSLCRPLFCTDGKLGVRWGMNTIRAGGAALSAGSSEALNALKASAVGSAEHLSALRLQGALSIFVWASVVLSFSLEWSLVAGRASSCLLLPACLGCLGDWWKVW